MTMRMFGNDLVINENDCNLSCQYCLTGQSNLKKSHEQKLIFQPPLRDTYDKASPLASRLKLISERTIATMCPPFLKITGGEIFLIRNILDFIECIAVQYEVVVVQTNGVLLKDEHIARLSKIENLVVQISLDSHLHSGNEYRIKDAQLHQRVIEKISNLLRSDLDVEIYSVLNDRNVSELHLIAQWLMGFDKKAVFFPFPVRGPDAEKYAIKPGQMHFIECFVEQSERFASVLPPPPYLRRLLDVMRHGERRFKCHVPRLVFSTFSDGVITACPNIWFNDMGNVTSDDWQSVVNKVGSTGLYKALLAESPRLDACKRCYTPWDILSMYFDDEISLDQLCATPTYRRPAIRALLAEEKQKYLDQLES
jgi:MoaA/NifB/PqqE/SkfB family radical SAM enzyme